MHTLPHSGKQGPWRSAGFHDIGGRQGAPAPGSVSYWNLHPYVRRNGPEGNYLGLAPTEFFADTSELYQLLKKATMAWKCRRRTGTAWSRGWT
ncbi:hypothetical protein M5E88_11980 [Akkermansia muciniphila]|nr:hypothetical protein M5E88_11980 [Akkermansia muciniphila]